MPRLCQELQISQCDKQSPKENAVNQFFIRWLILADISDISDADISDADISAADISV